MIDIQIKLGSQYYFYMENQTALAVPDEDNCMVVYSSTQSPELAHVTIAKCLGIPENNVRVLTRRVGGGFGGKSLRAMPVSNFLYISSYFNTQVSLLENDTILLHLIFTRRNYLL